MQKINKLTDTIVSTKYKQWVDNLDASQKQHSKSSTYYDDVVMNLYRCQAGVCAYTEMHLCTNVHYADVNWTDGRYKIPDDAKFKREGHFGQLEHFDHNDKKLKHWNWDNLFMIHSTINSRKSDAEVIPYIKPDLAGYTPETYFEYDDDFHLFIPNQNIKDPQMQADIQYMIDEVLFLNHDGVVRYRTNYLNNIKLLKRLGEPIVVEEFFTAVKWTLDI